VRSKRNASATRQVLRPDGGADLTANLTETDRESAAEIVALFSVLVHSWQTNRFHKAAKSRAELERLGVRVELPVGGSSRLWARGKAARGSVNE
jgi:hypothetical protein